MVHRLSFGLAWCGHLGRVRWAPASGAGQAVAGTRPASPFAETACWANTCQVIDSSGDTVTDWCTETTAPSSVCTYARYYANGTLVAETGTKCLSSGQEATAIPFSFSRVLGGEPYWQEVAERLQLRGPRQTWREGRRVLMEQVSRDTDSQVSVVSASRGGTSPLWLRVAVLSATGTAVETHILCDSIAARADETAELVERTQLVASSNPAVSP